LGLANLRVSPISVLPIERRRWGFLAAAGGGTRDQDGGIGGAEAVVDVNYGHVGRAGVEHAEEGGGSIEAGAVADGGGDGDDGDADEAADDGGKSAFHAGADDDYVGLVELLADGEKAVDAGYADVVEAGDVCVEELGGDGGLFGDELVAGAGGQDGDVAFGFVRCLPEGDGAGLRVIDGGGDGGQDGFGGEFVDAGAEDVGAGGGHVGEDFGGLFGGFALRVDDLGETGTERAVMIDAGVAEVFVGKVGEALGGGGGSEGSGLDGGE
jgi:hypothetical protein